MTVRAKAKGLQLELQFDGPIPETIQVDPIRLRQILINVVGNAIKFTETGSVRISAHMLSDTESAPRLRFNVKDTGIGIASDKIDGIFKPFTQADGSMTRVFGGTGLGLSISKRLAELLGGHFTVCSILGHGSTFSFTVTTGPLDDVRMISDLPRPNANPTNEKPVEPKCLSIRNRRVLLAEDGPDNQRLISFILRKAGAEVTVADNGQVALELTRAAMLQGCSFDVILMDMQMPVMDGYAATRKLREEEYTLPVIALTAHAMFTDRKKCLDVGCDDYATKPVNAAQLIETVARHSPQYDVTGKTESTEPIGCSH